MSNNESETRNPMPDMVSKGKYEVSATFQIGNNEAVPVMLTFTAGSALDGDKNIVLVFNGEYYNGTINCPKIDDIKGTFMVAGDTYTLNKVDELSSSKDLNYVQLKCDGVVHQFELVDVTKQVASNFVSSALGQALANVKPKTGGKHSRKAGKKAGKNASYKVGGRRAKRRTIRRRGTRKK